MVWLGPPHFTIKKLLGVSCKHLFLCFLLSFVHGFLKYLNTFLPKELHLKKKKRVTLKASINSL